MYLKGLIEMIDLNYYNKEKHKITEDIGNYISGLRKCEKILNSVNLPLLNFDELIGKLDGIVKSLIDDKVRISVLAEVSNGKSTFLNTLIFREPVLEARIGIATARLYRISYGEEYTIKYKNSEEKMNSLEEIKEFIKQLNKETLNKARESEDGRTVLSISEDELSVFIYIPLEHLKVGIEIIDTPWFGILNKELTTKLINEVVYSSDAVITILDINLGIMKSEIENFSKLLSMVKPDNIYIVFNKIDAYEDEKYFDSIGKDVVDNVNEILKNQGYDQKIDMKQLFYVSSKYALKGFINQEKGENIDERTKKYMEMFEKFEKEFWNNVVNYKLKEFLFDKISSFERIKEFIGKEVNNVYRSLINQLSLMEERYIMLAEQHTIIKMYFKLRQEADKCINKLKPVEIKADEIIFAVENEILQITKIDEYIDEKYGFWSSVFSKDEMEKEMKLRLKNANIQEIIKTNIQKYYTSVFEQIKSNIHEYNKKVDELNYELEELGIKRFKFPKAEYKEMQMLGEQLQANQVTNQVEVERAEIYVPVMGYLLGSMLGGAVEQLILGGIFGPAGLVGGILAGTFLASENIRKKKEEMKQKIREGIHDSLNILKKEINRINNTLDNYIDNIKNGLLREIDSVGLQILKMLEEKKLDVEIEKIEEVKNQLNALRNVANILKIKIMEET